MSDAPTMPPGGGARRILAVFNPAAGGNRRARFERVVAALRARGCAVTVAHTAARGDAERIARETAPDAYDVIAAAGGDGTVNELVNGIGERQCPLGVIPLGTANVLAREIGMRLTADDTARTLAEGPSRPIRVGRLNGRRFVMMAGVGFDANVVHDVSLALKRRIGPLAYVWQAAKEAFGSAYAPCSVTIEGTAHAATSVVVCNGRLYGGPFVVAPKGSLADDSFQIILMPGRGWFSVLRYGVNLVLGRLDRVGDVTIVPARAVAITGTPGQPVQADGDDIAALPVEIGVDPLPVNLIFPR